MSRLIDADAVLEKIDERIRLAELDTATKYGNETPEQADNSYQTWMKYEIADFVDDIRDDIDNAPTVIPEDFMHPYEEGYALPIDLNDIKDSESIDINSIYFNQEVPVMFGTNDTKAEGKRVYEVTVEAARKTKNDKIVMLDLDVNGIKIKSCMLKEDTVKKDGEKYKKGDTCFFLNFPSEKVGDKYYNRVWFPVSNECMADIIEQTKKIL